jgi:hypothetical protein
MNKIKLTKGKYAYVDERDFNRINQYNWHYLQGGYAARSEGGRKNKKMIYMHRFILDLQHGDKRVVDHMNKDKLDNRRSNLRICTQKENGRNSSKPKTRKFTSKYKGVYFDKERKKWIAKLKVNYRNVWIGRFDTEKEAAKAYNTQARIIFREFAELNKL